MKILCHVGPWCVKQYREIAKNVDPNAEVVLISHFTELDQANMANAYYKNLKLVSKIQFENNFDTNDFIKRCRLLRSLKKRDALLHLYSMKEAISEAFDLEKPDMVISEVIDQYLIDLIKYECDKRKIPFFGLVVSFINGYFRITSRGEKGITRDVQKSEVDSVLHQIEQITYTPNFVSKKSTSISNFINIYKRIISNWFRVPYFFFKRFLSGQKYNYHFWASQISASNNFHLIPAIGFADKNWKLKIRSIDKTIIYHPLQMFPEATIEYWCTCLRDIDYEKKLIRIISSMNSEFHFLIKEHPNVIGLRTKSLCKSLSTLNNVTIVPTNLSSNEVSEESNAILVWTGSAGFEAALRGKPVLTVCKPYYTHGRQFMKIDENTSNSKILEHIEFNSSKLSISNKEELLKNLLSGLRPGKYINDASWTSTNPEHIKQAIEIGQEIRKDLFRKVESS